MGIIKDDLTELELKQMENIDKLQRKIKLLEFDNSQSNKTINKLSSSLKYKRKTLNSVIAELEMMRKEGNYKRISTIIAILKRVVRDDFEE